MPPPSLSKRIEKIQGIRLAGNNPKAAWDIAIEYSDQFPNGTITAITPHLSHPSNTDHDPPLALPTLTHPHIHLDKAFVHSAREYAHLLPSKGSFQEALSFTTQAKTQFKHADLTRRGEWLLAESVSAGVTAMRAFVEVDQTVGLTCLEVGLELKDRWKDCCTVQIVCFAQDPIFSGEHGDENHRLINEALERYPQIDVIGTTPYVESNIDAAKRNIDWAIERAMELGKHVDFHLDYNLDPNKEALIWYVVQTLQRKKWTAASTSKRITLGHCTRLTLFTEEEWGNLAKEISQNDLPVSFVGLPTSDMYMASPNLAANDPPHDRPRGTLQIPEMIRKHGLDAAIGVNNVGNAFTPWGSADPLCLACLGVGVYQAGTQQDAELLYECVSTRARAAIGLPCGRQGSDLTLREGDQPDLLLIYNVDDTGCNVSRSRKSVAEVVWDPPAKVCRHIVSNGRLKMPSAATPSETACYSFKT
ncbi:putative zinc metallopeptidase [Aspergillus clavatus NRRL 1]|uniref:Zinc metallopeptidase, putative n=1 Tax=Aspergillus clavatus (strain ATCC 1007 / CBS 513.65 / DSM 816 / NCTC 3887 / NRRL 1 / QM 1276 / 107) TaxID=344612 RepID=A1CR37_ASPCL|nr:zinc metallopeptidase, putative [Aspergillus clavatus NRRL 1]EAW08108.1 zinc metallopeptidase, putative [Aspergillus clavatus NRRL 1]